MNFESQSSNALDHRFYNLGSFDGGISLQLPVLLLVQSNSILKACKKYVETICLTVLE